MNNQVLANTTFLVLGIVCFVLAIRAFFVYALSKSNLLFVIGLSMADIGISVVVGFLQDSHVTTWNAHVSWYVGTIIGIFFLVIGSWATSNETILTVRRWLIIFTAIFFIVTLLTPIWPPFPNPYIPATLNVIRTVIGLIGCIRYLILYISKRTRFTLLMCICFLLIGAGFGVLTPQLFDTNLQIFLTFGYSLRIVGYTTLLITYSLS